MKINYRADRMFDGYILHDEESVVQVQEDRITYVGPARTAPTADETKNFGDATITPGLFDCHVHIAWTGLVARPQEQVQAEGPVLTALRSTQSCKKHLRAATTTIRDLGTGDGVSYALRAAEADGLIESPRILASGPLICMTGGHCYEIGGEADGRDEVMKRVRREIRDGADLIKLAAGGGIYGLVERCHHPQFTIEEMKAAVEVAHNADRLVTVHAYSKAAIRNALDAGVDCIEHGSCLTYELADRMVREDKWLVPTLSIFGASVREGKKLNVPEIVYQKTCEIYEASKECFRIALESGVKMAAGTDCGGPGHPHGTVPTELAVMVEYGASPLFAFTCATSNAAKLCELSGVTGMLRTGLQADIAVFSENPFTNIRAVFAPRATIHRGIFYPL